MFAFALSGQDKIIQYLSAYPIANSEIDIAASDWLNSRPIIETAVTGLRENGLIISNGFISRTFLIG